MGLLPLLAATLLGQVQAPPTLAAYLKLHPEEGGLTVGAESAKADGSGSGLARYDRKRVSVGEVKAVVPLTMVRFEDNLGQPANLYEGLPRQAKILYLMTLLNGAQWRKATTEGLGTDDLRGEAKAVLASILPKHPTWYAVQIKPGYAHSEAQNWQSLDEKGAAGMKLKLENTLELIVRFEGTNSSSSFSPSSERGKPGETVLYRANTEDEAASSTYGVTMRETVPNTVKRGQLDTASLSAAVKPPSQTTVGELLSLVGQKTGREILADIRVRDLSVSYPGGAARAGDLLDAVALAVCGTYRRIDRTYLLVADVVGVGSRRIRQTAWKEEIDLEVERRKQAWTAGVRNSGIAGRLEFPDDPSLSPTPAVRDRLDGWLKKEYPLDTFGSGDLSVEQRSYLDRVGATLKDRTIDRDRLSARANLQYRFLLPDGKPLQLEGTIDMLSRFAPRTSVPEPVSPDPIIPKSANAPGEVRPLVLHAASVPEANAAVKTAKAFGFSELWLETERPEVLTAAIQTGFPVRLFVRPWALATPSADSDKSIIGLTGSATEKRQGTALIWTELAADQRREVYPRLPRRLADGDLISPWDSRWPDRRAAIVRLAQTPGLAGVVLSGTAPHGYEGVEDGGNLYSRTLAEEWTFGYDEPSRLAFFRKAGYDPVDLTTEALRTDVDFDTPTFPRYPARPLALVREAYTMWTVDRGKANQAAVVALRSALVSVPVLCDVRKMQLTQAPRESETFVPWTLGAPIPQYDDQFVPQTEGAISLTSAPEPRFVNAMNDFGNGVKFFAPLPEKGWARMGRAVDLRKVPAAQWSSLLTRWLQPVELLR